MFCRTSVKIDYATCLCFCYQKCSGLPKKRFSCFGGGDLLLFLKIIILSSKKKRAGMVSRYATRVVTDMMYSTYVFFYSFFFEKTTGLKTGHRNPNRDILKIQ